jgi:hypothetical protein
VLSRRQAVVRLLQPALGVGDGAVAARGASATLVAPAARGASATLGAPAARRAGASGRPARDRRGSGRGRGSSSGFSLSLGSIFKGFHKPDLAKLDAQRKSALQLQGRH